MTGTWWVSSVPTLILVAGVAEDLRTRKVRNRVVLICMAGALAFAIVNHGTTGLVIATVSLSAAFFLYAPLVYLRILGAGDMKLMMAFSLSTTWETTVSVSIYALLWGAVLGLVRAAISGQLLSLLKSTARLPIEKTNLETPGVHTIPYTVALLFGWFSHLAYSQGGFL